MHLHKHAISHNILLLDKYFHGDGDKLKDKNVTVINLSLLELRKHIEKTLGLVTKGDDLVKWVIGEFKPEAPENRVGKEWLEMHAALNGLDDSLKGLSDFSSGVLDHTVEHQYQKILAALLAYRARAELFASFLRQFLPTFEEKKKHLESLEVELSDVKKNVTSWL